MRVLTIFTLLIQIQVSVLSYIGLKTKSTSGKSRFGIEDANQRAAESSANEGKDGLDASNLDYLFQRDLSDSDHYRPYRQPYESGSWQSWQSSGAANIYQPVQYSFSDTRRDSPLYSDLDCDRVLYLCLDNETDKRQQGTSEIEPCTNLSRTAYCQMGQEDHEDGELPSSDQSGESNQDMEEETQDNPTAWVRKQRRTDRVRKLLDQAWTAKGLNCQMDPRDLVLEVTWIKCDLQGQDIDGIGMIASNKIKESADEDYRDTYQLFAKRYGTKLRKIQDSTILNTDLKTEEQKRRFVHDSIAKYQEKVYTLRILKDNKSKRRDLAAEMESKNVWNAFMAHLTKESEIDATRIASNDWTVAMVEENSRDLALAGLTPDRTMELLKRYITRYLGKNGGDMARFTILRRNYRRRCQIQIRHQKIQDKRSADGLPPKPPRRHLSVQKS